MVKFLEDNPKVGARDFDKNPDNFLSYLSEYDYQPETEESKKDTNTSKDNSNKQGDSSDSDSSKKCDSSDKTDDTNDKNSSSNQQSIKRKSVKHKPVYTRKKYHLH
jgi:hypothetical protein